MIGYAVALKAIYYLNYDQIKANKHENKERKKKPGRKKICVDFEIYSTRFTTVDISIDHKNIDFFLIRVERKGMSEK